MRHIFANKSIISVMRKKFDSMKLLPLVICFIMTMACCTSKHADVSSDTSQTAAIDSREKTPIDTSIVRSNDEDFIAFIKRFHTDTTFQLQRVCDSVYRNYRIEVTTLYSNNGVIDTLNVSQHDYVWDIDKLKSKLRFCDYAITDSTSIRMISIKSDTVIEENFFIDQSGTQYILEFLNRGHKWFLTALDANVL